VLGLGDRPGGALCPAPVWLAGLHPDATGAAGTDRVDRSDGVDGSDGSDAPGPVLLVEPTSVEPDLTAFGGPDRPATDAAARCWRSCSRARRRPASSTLRRWPPWCRG